MTDIVERLRERHNDTWPQQIGYGDLYNQDGLEAADEIERLRKEIERLREVLEIISKPTYGTELYDTAYQRAEMYWQHLKRFQAIAKKALEK